MDSGVHFHVRGKVRWRRTIGSAATPVGMALEFLDSEANTAIAVKEFAAAVPPRSVKPRMRRFPAMTLPRRV